MPTHLDRMPHRDRPRPVRRRGVPAPVVPAVALLRRLRRSEPLLAGTQRFPPARRLRVADSDVPEHSRILLRQGAVILR